MLMNPSFWRDRHMFITGAIALDGFSAFVILTSLTPPAPPLGLAGFVYF